MNSDKAKTTWQVQTAKARFSEVFRKARAEGPQTITKQGTEAVVMVAYEQYERLAHRGRTKKTLREFFRESPFVGVELELEREKDQGREIDL